MKPRLRHSARMTIPDEADEERRGGLAGGFLLAFSILAGLVIGTLYQEPIIGVLSGFGIGVVLLILVWIVDRRRPRRR